MIFNGLKIVKKNKQKIKKYFSKLNFRPKLAIIVLNGLENQKDFLKFKVNFANSIGVDIIVYDWTNNTNEYCLNELKKLSNDSNINGIIVQLPANKNFDIESILKNIPSEKDVDGLNPSQINVIDSFVGAANRAIISLLKKYNLLKNKKVLLIGRNIYFAKPLYEYLKFKKYLITQIKSSELETWMYKVFPIIISTVNKPLFINCHNIPKNSIAIDLTYHKNSNNKPLGSFYGTNNHLKLFTPVPGGIGPLTIYYLFENLYFACLKQIKNKTN